jgi:2-dehydro-3-deoxygluconokinase
MYDWDNIFSRASWLHLSGITTAISAQAVEAVILVARKAQAARVKVSVDLNFRKKLWNWEQSTSDIFGIKADDTDVTSGKLSIDGYSRVVDRLPVVFLMLPLLH